MTSTESLASTVNRPLHRGFTLVEMAVVTAMLAILATLALPVARTAATRTREIELRRALREIRQAIDRYHDFALEKKVDLPEEQEHYPANLQDLVDGLEYRDEKGLDRVERFLRRIPRDPVSGKDWILRSLQDKPDNRRWGRENVFDVRSASTSKALDGTSYQDW